MSRRSSPSAWAGVGASSSLLLSGFTLSGFVWSALAFEILFARALAVTEPAEGAQTWPRLLPPPTFEEGDSFLWFGGSLPNTLQP